MMGEYEFFWVSLVGENRFVQRLKGCENFVDVYSKVDEAYDL